MSIDNSNAACDADCVLDSLVLTSPGGAGADLGPIWILEEVAGHLRSQGRTAPRMRLYRLNGDELTAEKESALDAEGRRTDVALALLAQAKARRGVVVCSFRTVTPAELVKSLEKSSKLQYVVELDPSRRIEFARAREGVKSVHPLQRVNAASWRSVNLKTSAGAKGCFAANLGKAELGGVEDLTCFALSIGGIKGYRRGILVGITSVEHADNLTQIAQLLAWTRWIRLAVRKARREQSTKPASMRAADNSAISILGRSNRRIAAEHDEKEAKERSQRPDSPIQLQRRLTAGRRTLNVVELFAGAGGMGLGFLSARGPGQRGYRLTGSAEINPIYVQTLKQNHAYMDRTGLARASATPDEYAPMDLCSSKVRSRLQAIARVHGDVDVLIGGPPCQGFSNANRNSWSSSNPNNQLVDAFLDCVSLLAPKVLLMENVQGILWTPREDTDAAPSVAAHVLHRLAAMGYQVFPKLLDAVWYGVPQNRNRFFLLGIHTDLGYSQGSFGRWGPFPAPTHGPGTTQPFVTVRDAIGDLPRVSNGDASAELPYEEDELRLQRSLFIRTMRAGAPKGVIWDHVTSQHAEYVIERYKAIGQGQNWEAVRELMTNYADVERTHSNIYRRLAWSEPAITIGHYRKSMIIHPAQHRGLSLREAARLQSFPDWFRFAGSASGGAGGLMHKQQQLANAVCPVVTKAVAEFILDL